MAYLHTMQLDPLDLAVIAIYFVAMAGVGIWSVTRARTGEDYLVAGRRLRLPMFSAAMAATAVGGAVTVGGAQRGYTSGLAGIWVGGALGLGLLALGFLVSSKLSRLRALSVNEVIERNYGASARLLGAVLTIIYTVALAVVQVVAMGAILSAVTSWDTRTCMLISGGVVVFYIVLGGMWSVTMTDTVQFAVKTVGIMILFPIFALSDDRIGGLSGLVDKLPKESFDIGALGFDGTLYWLLLYIPGLIIGQDIWQRVFTARNDRTARTGTLIAGTYSILYAGAAVLVGMCVAVVANLGDAPQKAFATGVAEFLPVGVAGLLLAAAIAAAMSVASATILACSTVAYNDIYLRLGRGQRSAALESEVNDGKVAKSVWINRALAVLVGVVVMGLAWLIEDIFTALDLSYTYLSGCVFVPVLAAFLLKRVSPKAGLISLAVSATGVTAAFFYGRSTGHDEWTVGVGNYPIMLGMALSLITYVVVSLIDKNKVPANATDVREVEGEQPGANAVDASTAADTANAAAEADGQARS